MSSDPQVLRSYVSILDKNSFLPRKKECFLWTNLVYPSGKELIKGFCKGEGKTGKVMG